MNKHRNKKPKPKIHIFHNGEVAESDYFGDFAKFLHDNDAWVIIQNYHKRTKGKAPWQLINEAAKLKISKEDGDQIWCVFDVDDFYKNNKDELEKAVKKAENKNIKIAYSNRCFELWLMLHFEQISTAIYRKNYEEKLQKFFKKIGISYEKNMRGIFELLQPHQKEAIKRAKKSFVNRIDSNPSTSVFMLVEELNKFLTDI